MFGNDEKSHSSNLSTVPGKPLGKRGKQKEIPDGTENQEVRMPHSDPLGFGLSQLRVYRLLKVTGFPQTKGGPLFENYFSNCSSVLLFCCSIPFMNEYLIKETCLCICSR